ncbi:MAG TPA: hypothetical protein VEX70_16440 [Pyrinomonadaceae bacterium]|nr:hypothetical protein [Pyrinomonadaceae bacterium]
MSYRPPSAGVPQPNLPFIESTDATSSGVGLTFRESKNSEIHRWYPYVEGFSAEYIRSLILGSEKKPKSIYDPFGGSGTTQLESSKLGIHSYFSEINPFMAFVALTKVNVTKWAHHNLSYVEKCFNNYIGQLNNESFQKRVCAVSLDDYKAAFPERDFFVENHIRELLSARDLAVELASDSCEIRDLLLLAIAANVVGCSNMTRRADLRRRRPDEYKTRVVDTVKSITEKIREIVNDIKGANYDLAVTEQASPDAKVLPDHFHESFDLAVTSPPYLNGTNYFRNTKLELWFLSYIKSEDELKSFYRRAVAGGINNISKDKAIPHEFKSVESVAVVLDQQTRDSRIPKLVRTYFSDMYDVLSSVWKSLVYNGRFIVDIGDSKFYGVHVPTDKLLVDVAKEVGFEVDSMNELARRYSRDKTPLQQIEIVLRKPAKLGKHKKVVTAAEDGLPSPQLPIRKAISYFRESLPYKVEPYSKKSWGHPLHSLCSYQGKLKPALAHWLVSIFSEPGMSILDPLGGVGTIGFEACLQGRHGISNDLSPLASVIAKGKLSPPSIGDTLEALESFKSDLSQIKLTGDDYEAANFGLNAKVKDYFHVDTLEDVLKARRVFLDKVELTATNAFIKACLLHILHGNRPYALSRTSHPLTPYNPRGEFEYKSLVQKLEERLRRILSVPLPSSFVAGTAFHDSFRNLRSLVPIPIDRIITSPPFIGMRFDRPNWMRLWFCGWQAKDFHATHENFLERQQMKSLVVYTEFFDVCADLLSDGGVLILHLGGSSKYDMLTKLIDLAAKRFTFLETVSECVADVERHGIRDKGTTSIHHFLFLEKKR